MSYGSSKESSGSTPSESSGSAPDESSSESSGVIDGGSSSSAGSSQASSSGTCSYFIHDIAITGSDDTMRFSITNDGSEVLEITAITTAVPISPDTPLPIFLLSGLTIEITVTGDGTDLRGLTFTVFTSCGDQSDVFPVS